MNNTAEFRHVLVIEDQKSRRIVSLQENTYTIGRDPNSTVILYDRQVSRHHATLVRVNDYQSQDYFYRVIDGNLQGKRSTNGITVNGNPCLTHELKNGDVVRFGSKSQISYQVIAQSTESGTESSYTDLSPVQEHLDFATVNDSRHEFASKDYETKSTDVYPDAFDKEEVQSEDSSFSTAILYHNDSPSKTSRPRSIDRSTLVPDSTLVEHSPQAIFELTFDGKISYLNAATTAQFPELETAKVCHPLVDGLVTLSSPEDGLSFVREVVIDSKIYEQHIYYFSNNKKIYSYIFDITEQKKASLESQVAQQNYHLYQQLTTEGIFWVDGDTKKILETNLSYGQLLGYQQDELLKLTLYQVFAETPKVVDDYLAAVPETEALMVEECLQRKSDGSSLKVSVKLTHNVLQERQIYGLVVQDLGSQKQVEEALQFQVLHDPITGLPNRQFFEQQLAIALDHAKHHQHLFAVLFFNLDSFKNINNSLGHKVGDRALKAFGEQLQSCIRSEDVLCSWGGDQFCVLLPQIRNTEDAIKLTQRLFEKLGRPIAIDSHEFHLKSSIGIAVYPQDGEDAETLLKHADTALHRTKIGGRNHYQFYDPKLGAEATLLLRLENLLDQAIARKQLSLHYQPQMNIKTRQITGMEALLRWENPEVGFIPPAKFIPLAAKTDLIFQIGKWVLQTACEQNITWQKEGLPPFPIAVNFCSKEFYHPRLVETIGQVLTETGLDSHWLEIEVTEATLRLDPAKARKTLEDIKSLGVRVALDDFGTGSSALGSLKYFPLNTLKIDQNFIRDLRNDSHDVALISAILAMGRGFNLRIVAEGIENDYQLNIVHHLQCEEGQGYLLSRPLKVKDTTQFLQEQFLKP